MIRATEGELQRTIAGLTPVESARVHIAAPEASLYSSHAGADHRVGRGPHQARRWISRRKKSAGSRSSSPVRSTGSSPRTSRSSTRTAPCWCRRSRRVNDVAGRRAEVHRRPAVAKQRYETNLQENIQGMLDAAIGPKRSAVRVATDMNFDADQDRDRIVRAATGRSARTQTERETFAGHRAPPRQPPVGIPGTTTNAVPTYQGPAQQGTSRYSRSKSTTNYEITKSNTKAHRRAGQGDARLGRGAGERPAHARGGSGAARPPSAAATIAHQRRRREDPQRRLRRGRDRPDAR